MPKPENKVRILIVDDHGMLRDSLEDLLNDQPGMNVVGSCGSGEDAVRAAKKLKPDIVLMDIKMGGLSGLQATRQIKSESPDIKIIILSTYEDEGHILDAFRAGADGYVPKTFPAAKMIESIEKIHRGGALVPETILPKLLQGIRSLGASGAETAESSDLTPMERKVLAGVKRGLPGKSIGQDLGISEKTVRNHLNNAFLKLGAKNRTEAIVKAIQQGILSLED